MNPNEWADQFEKRLAAIEEKLDRLASKSKMRIGYKGRKDAITSIVDALRALQSDVDNFAVQLDHYTPKGHRANWGQITNELRSLGIFDNGR